MDIDSAARAGDFAALERFLLDASEEERRAFAGELEKKAKALDFSDAWTSLPVGYALAAIGCMPSAARAAALLGRANMRSGWGGIPADAFLRLAHARELPWLGDLGLRLAGTLTVANLLPGQWHLCDLLLREAGVRPPVTEGVTRAWLSHELQAVDPFLDDLLPAVFHFDGAGAVLNEIGAGEPTFPDAVAALVASGRLDRPTYLALTLDRLVRGDRPAFLRPFTRLLERLDPSVDEIARHTADYVALLPDAPSPVAALAQRALRALDDAGRLDFSLLLSASPGVLLRKEKTLVNAQLSWLGRAAHRDPRALAEVVAVAFGHPALDVQERALTLIERLAPAPSSVVDSRPAPSSVVDSRPAPSSVVDSRPAPSPVPGGRVGAGVPRFDAELSGRLAAAAEGLGGDLRARAVALFGGGVVPASAEPAFALRPPLASAFALPPPAPAPPAPLPPAGMPPPIASPAELAEEVVALAHGSTGVRWERVLAGLVALHHADADLAGPLVPILERESFDTSHLPHEPWWFYLGLALRAVTGDERRHPRWPGVVSMIARARHSGRRAGALSESPDSLLSLRLAEAALELRLSPVPLLLATPTEASGSLDPAVLLDRLRQAESAGWEPWPADFEQALLRLPRQVPPAIIDAAATLTSPHGRRFTAWLRAGGLPDPVSERIEQRPPVVEPWEQDGIARRVVVSLSPARTESMLVLEPELTTLKRGSDTLYRTFESWNPSILTMALPHHREIAAAWGLPRFSDMAEDYDNGGGPLLPLLAECDGPFGTAMSLILAYGLTAAQAKDRVAAVDAFLTLAAAKTTASSAAGTLPFAAAVGTDLADLSLSGTVKLGRAVTALNDAHRAGASEAVWSLAAAALPLLLPAPPRGLPDLLELATQAALACGASADETLAGPLTDAASRPGSTRLAKEARRLRTVLNP